ncbi:MULTISPECIES: hypothetical protein [unclassified Bradyrhizobium]
MRLLLDIVIALLVLPVFLVAALLVAVVFGLVGGGASAFVSAWPVIEYYHDRFLLSVIPSSWTAGLIRRAEACVDFYSDQNRRR